MPSRTPLGRSHVTRARDTLSAAGCEACGPYASARTVIYQLTDADQTVRVAAIRHRSIAYRSDPP